MGWDGAVLNLNGRSPAVLHPIAQRPEVHESPRVRCHFHEHFERVLPNAQSTQCTTMFSPCSPRDRLQVQATVSTAFQACRRLA